MAALLLGVRILCALYLVFMLMMFWGLYIVYNPIPCYSEANQCLKNYIYKTPPPLLKLWVYSSTSQSLKARHLSLVWELNSFSPHQSFTKDVTVRIPSGRQDCPTVFLHVLLAPVEEGRGGTSPFDADWKVNGMGNITEYAHHKDPVAGANHLTCHWRSCATFIMMTDDVTFDREALPAELADYVQPYKDQYLPMLVVDEMHFRTKDLLPLNTTCKEMPLKISYTPVSYGKFLLGLNMTGFINQNGNGIHGKKAIDKLKPVFQYLVPSIIVIIFHLLFLALAVESDVNFWQDRKTMGGLSTQTVIWGSVSTVVYFLHVMNGKTHTVIKVIYGFLAFVEIWKVLKVFRAKVSWTEWRLVFDNAGFNNKELDTQTFDSQAMRCLSSVLYPLWTAVIINSVKNNFPKGFYTFGFLFKLPQVFINYKLKSVDDLPWKVIVYEVVITVICCIYRFVFTFPVRDDGHLIIDVIIYLVYFYQAWLYSH